MTRDKPDRQRALVLQGGGALGAYEVGVIKELCTRLMEKHKDKENKPLFDIVAGTSIGATNAAILVSNVVKKDKTWNKASEELERFWKDGIALKEGTTPDDDIVPTGMFRLFPWWKPWSKDIPNWAPYVKQTTNCCSQDKGTTNTNDLATEEAARRYYSTKEFVLNGKKVFSVKEVRNDKKFLDQGDLTKWFVLNDAPFREQIERFGDFPIATRLDKGQPRLLVTAVDIAEGIAVTFDSYKKSDGKRKTVYYPGTKYGHRKQQQYKDNNNDKNSSKPVVIEYENGITLEHVMASNTLPGSYDPKEIDGRKFWDGGLLSNTPLRELLQSHREYWVNVENKDEAPDLDIYIVNVHPSKISINNLPKHYDEVQDRNESIVYGDRTYNDQYATSLATDYIDFIKSLKDVAINYIKDPSDRDAFQKKFESLKAGLAKSTSYTVGEHTKYEDLIRGRFELTKVERIEYNPKTSTSFKLGDITPQTISELIEEGQRDAKYASIS